MTNEIDGTAAAAGAADTVATQSKRQKSFFKRFRKKSSKKKANEPAPVPTEKIQRASEEVVEDSVDGRSDDVQADDGRSDDVQADDGRSGDVQADDGQSGDVQADDGRSGDVQMDDGRSGDVQMEDGRSGDVNTDDGRSDDVRMDDGRTDDSRKDDDTETSPRSPTSEDGVPELELSHDGSNELDEIVAAADAAAAAAAAARPITPVTKDGLPVVSSLAPDEFLPSDVREHDEEVVRRGRSFLGAERGVLGSQEESARSLEKVSSSFSRKELSRARMRSTVVLKKAPTAREAAFGGPPRYDWIDIETAAAVKVQAAYRRSKVMWELEKQGKSTAAMRNRIRQRKSRKKAMQSEDVPSFLACCGVGFLFGDATGEDQAVLDMQRKQEYEEKRRQKEEEETERRKLRYRRRASKQMVEEFEVVEPVAEDVGA